jgi:hypothetical protein
MHPNVILSQDSQVENLEIPEIGNPITLKAHNFCENFWLRWNMKQSCNLCWELFNDMWHTTCMQINQGDSWLLMVGSPIDNLTPGPSFGHNLCFKYPNGSCELILDIYIPRNFQWYHEFFNAMSFDPCKYLLKIWESIRTLSPKVGAHLGVWGFLLSHFPTLLGTWNVIPMLHFWPAPL